MSHVEINGLRIFYDLIGDGERVVVITPGGRASKEAPGIRKLAESLAEQGLTALIWDRPNCGESDLCFEGESEAEMCAAILAALLQKLGLPPVTLAAASAGIRPSLIAAARHSNMVEGLFLWWITGGAAGFTAAVHFSYGESVVAAATGGMENLLSLSAWKETVQKNPNSGEKLLQIPPEIFIAKMQLWGLACLPNDDAPAPGISVSDLERIKAPALILKNGRDDPYHILAASEHLARAMPNARLVPPPWREDEFTDRLKNVAREGGLFVRSHMLAPAIADFAKSEVDSRRQ